MAAGKTLPIQPTGAERSKDQAELSEDITRVVSYLNARRSNTSDRKSALVQEITHRRDETSDAVGLRTNEALASRLTELVDALPKRELNTNAANTNPALAERYHSFCHDLDVILESFKARIEIDKPIQH